MTVAPGASVTLRYAYGLAHARRRSPRSSKRWRAARNPFAHSERAWRAWLPRVRFGAGRAWLSRELQWDAYMLRSGTTYEETCGHHIISQGGYYQYEAASRRAYRDPLQHMLPLIYADPELARETIRYSAEEQPQAAASHPLSRSPRCASPPRPRHLRRPRPVAAAGRAEYGLATRDLAFFDERLRWADGGGDAVGAPKPGLPHQETQRGPHGGYITGATGDWSDFSTPFLGMTESILVTAQPAYVYPRLAELAAPARRRRFAAQLRADAAQLRAVLAREWTGTRLVLARLRRRCGRSATARSTASRSRGRCSPACRAPARRGRWWRTSAAS